MVRNGLPFASLTGAQRDPHRAPATVDIKSERALGQGCRRINFAKLPTPETFRKHAEFGLASTSLVFTSMQDLAQEQLRAFVLRMLEESLWLVDLDDLSIGHEYDPIGHLPGKTHFVGDDQHGDA